MLKLKLQYFGHLMWRTNSLEKKYIKAVYCHIAYLSYMEITSCKMLGWMKHKLESRVLGSVQFSRSVMSNSLQPYGLQHARPSCLSPTPGAYSNSCPLCWWCHPTISSSGIPFSSCLQSFPASGSFPMSQFFASGGQSIGAFKFSINPSNEYSGLISFRDWLVGYPCSPWDLQESFPTPQFKGINSSALSFLYSPTLTSMHDHRKNHSFE